MFLWVLLNSDTNTTCLGCFSDIVKETGYFFSDEFHFEETQIGEMKGQLPLLAAFQKAFAGFSGTFDGPNFLGVVKETGRQMNLKGKPLYHPLRLALTGREDGPELVKVAPLLGRDKVVARLSVWTQS